MVGQMFPFPWFQLHVKYIYYISWSIFFYVTNIGFDAPGNIFDCHAAAFIDNQILGFFTVGPQGKQLIADSKYRNQVIYF